MAEFYDKFASHDYLDNTYVAARPPRKEPMTNFAASYAIGPRDNSQQRLITSPQKNRPMTTLELSSLDMILIIVILALVINIAMMTTRMNHMNDMIKHLFVVRRRD